MSNVEAFDKHYLKKLIEPFLPGATEHITPIMYKAFTPDMFMFLFRTTDKDQQDHFFISFQYDYVSDMNRVGEIVKDWIGSAPLQAIPLAQTNTTDDKEDKEFICEDDAVYKSVLLLVPRPKNLGYWSEYIVVSKDDDVDVVLKDFTVGEREEVKKVLIHGSNERMVSVCRIHGEMELFYSA